MARIVDVGAIIIKAQNPAALAEWYAGLLGVEFHLSGGCHYGTIPTDREGGFDTQFGILQAKDFMAKDNRSVTVNYRVDDLDGVLAQLGERGIPLGERSSDEYGEFAWLKDPEGNSIELWQPPKQD
ncbi:VOC family protein [Candidatus Poribacteria bacterium]|nr:VOC family protein [Candidatus Poribacteria bacterium]